MIGRYIQQLIINASSGDMQLLLMCCWMWVCFQSRNSDAERAYATYFVDVERIEQIKKEGQDKVNALEDKPNP